MTDRSAYLVQALQQMQQAPAAAPSPSMDPQMMAQAVKGRDTWQAKNPGGNYAAHGTMQRGRSVMGVPGTMMGALGQFPAGLAGLIPGIARR